MKRVSHPEVAPCQQAAQAVISFLLVNWEDVDHRELSERVFTAYETLKTSCQSSICEDFLEKVPGYVLCWVSEVEGLHRGSRYRIRHLNGDEGRVTGEIHKVREWIQLKLKREQRKK